MSDTWPKIGPSGLPYWELAPGGAKDYGFDWSIRFPDDPLNSSSWDVPDVFTVDDEGYDAGESLVWITAVTAVRGRRYTLTNAVTTVAGRKDSKSLEILIKDL